ncbi:hypothetical protein AB0K00_52095 [Dactylosporangium sp. NPDC049525]|uniref:hypothetical protein n=1 Tax=Dactylosporangium sp. NPDC049525 TaxID=3154730 RepID=UPI003421BD46
MMKLKILVPALALAAVLLTGAGVWLVVGGPGGGKADPGASAGTDQEQALKFAQCMRDNGVDMPDPGDGNIVTGAGGDGSGPIGGADAVDLDADGAAFEACRKFLPNGGEMRKPTAAELEQQVRYAQCMRAHGIDYPDPTADGIQQLPGIPVDDPGAMQRFDDAARACDAANSPAPKR